jgi:hypothetical protein
MNRNISYYRVYIKNYGIKEVQTLKEIHYGYTIHRDIKDGPAVLAYDKDDKLILVRYMLEGKLHHDTIAAVIKYDENGEVSNQEYWIFGVRFPKNDFKMFVARRTINLI